MIREDIEKAASEHSASLWDKNIINCSHDFDSAYDSFFAGAEWRINSVWHDVDIEPTEKTILVVIDDTGEISQSNFSPVFESWKEYVKEAGIAKWCYKKDLIPNTEE